MCLLRVQFDWSFLCAVLHRQPDTEQLRPRGQHDYVRCGSSGYRNCSRWFWFPLDRLVRMVIQIPETTRHLALYRQEQLISRVNRSLELRCLLNEQSDQCSLEGKCTKCHSCLGSAEELCRISDSA